MKTKRMKWLALLMLSLTACYDFSVLNDAEFEFKPVTNSFIFPILNDEITIKQILEKNDSIKFIKIGSDNLITIVYKDSIDVGFNSNPEQFRIPTQSYGQTLMLPFIPTGVVNTSVEYHFSSPDYRESVETQAANGTIIELKSATFVGGTLQISIVNNFNHDIINGQITLASLKTTQGDTVKIPFTANRNSTFTYTANLSDYLVDAYDAASNQYNVFAYGISGTIRTIEGNTISSTDNISINLSIQNPVFRKITGKINYTFTQPNQSYNIDMFRMGKNIKFHLEDPKLSLHFENSYGVPMALTFNTFAFTDSVDQLKPITTSGTSDRDLKVGPGTKNYINYITGAQQIARDTLVLNKSNSNIAEAFNCAPKRINMGATVEIGDNTDNHSYFVNNTSSFKLKTEVEIPVHGWAQVIMSDTMEIDLPDLEDENYVVDSATIALNLKITNKTPMGVGLQVAFVQNNNTVTALLFGTSPTYYEPIVNSAVVDDNGNVQAGNEGVSTPVISISKTKYKKMAEADKMIVYFKLTTDDVAHQKSVKFLSTSSISLQGSLSLKATTTFKP